MHLQPRKSATGSKLAICKVLWSTLQRLRFSFKSAFPRVGAVPSSPGWSPCQPSLYSDIWVWLLMPWPKQTGRSQEPGRPSWWSSKISSWARYGRVQVPPGLQWDPVTNREPSQSNSNSVQWPQMGKDGRVQQSGSVSLLKDNVFSRVVITRAMYGTA